MSDTDILILASFNMWVSTSSLPSWGRRGGGVREEHCHNLVMLLVSFITIYVHAGMLCCCVIMLQLA